MHVDARGAAVTAHAGALTAIPPAMGDTASVGPHPYDHLLRSGALPHIWCPGCGIGTALGALIYGFEQAAIPKEKRVIVGGIGCSSRVVFYAKTDAYHTTHGRAIPFATGVKLANPSLNVVVFAGDGDLFAIGGNHFIHAARRNMDLLVVCINNFNYGMTGGQGGPTTPAGALSTTTPYGNAEFPFNLPDLASAAGATYVARWTTLDVRRLRTTFAEVLGRHGFRFVEVLAPCPVSFGKTNKIGSGAEEMEYYQGLEVLRSRVESTEIGKTDIELGKPIVVGRFVDRERETFRDRYVRVVAKARGLKS
ncbi:MAG: thiamine pyrophosphate-dependent enzyme [Thermoplasmata archaeon]